MDIKNIIALNISELRTECGMTQQQLAEMLNYSDKAISKWERGDSTPDAESLYKIADIFGINIEYLFTLDHRKMKKSKNYRHLLLMRRFYALLLFIVAAFLIAFVIYAFLFYRKPELHGKIWICFIYAATISSFLIFRYFKRQNSHNGIMISISCFLWLFLTNAYLQFLINGTNLWLIFIVGVPLQMAILLIYLIRRK